MTYLEKLIDSKRLISIEEYCNLISTDPKHSRYVKWLENDKLYSFGETKDLYHGMLKWNDEDEPGNWAGPFPLNYVKVIISKSDTTKTEVDVFNSNLNYVKTSRFKRHPQVLNRIGFDDNYWIRPFVDDDGNVYPDKLCSYSKMTDEELKLVEESETPAEHLHYQLSCISTLNLNYMLPKNTYTIEHPYRVHLIGTDDCSYSAFYNVDEPEILNWDIYYSLYKPSWYNIEKHYHFTN